MCIRDRYSLLFYLVVSCVLVPHRVCEKKSVVVRLFKGYTVFNKNTLEFEEKKLFWEFSLEGRVAHGGVWNPSCEAKRAA